MTEQGCSTSWVRVEGSGEGAALVHKIKHMLELAQARRRMALEATCEVARRLGLSDDGAHVLKDANNTLVVLPEPGVVSKVATSTIAAGRDEALRRELAIAQHLAAHDAPIVLPLPRELSGPHDAAGVLLTFWNYSPSDSKPDEPGLELGLALRAFHAALASFPEPLPPLWNRLERASRLFADQDATPELTRADRLLAASLYEQLRAAVSTDDRDVPIHGEPHGGNIVWTQSGPLFIDFEATCTGPLEADIAMLPATARAAFPEREDELIRVLSLAISFCVAAFCWAQRGRAPEVDEAAEFHLSVLRRSARRHDLRS